MHRAHCSRLQVFGCDTGQEKLFKQAIMPIVHEVMDGFNCTIFAYGQTGTGKTYTMEGGPRESDDGRRLSAQAGVIPRSIKQIFDHIEASNIDSTVKVSFLELYNEELTDLLSLDDPSSSESSKKLRCGGAVRLGWVGGCRSAEGGAGGALRRARRRAERGWAAGWRVPRAARILGGQRGRGWRGEDAAPSCAGTAMPLRPCRGLLRPRVCRLLEDRSGVVVQGLEEVIVRTATEIYQVRRAALAPWLRPA